MDPSYGPAGAQRPLQPHSCTACKVRKVKCDKRWPCTACTKNRSQCVFRAPAPPRRGKNKPTDANLLARIKRYEDILQGLGVKIESIKVDDTHGEDGAAQKPGESTVPTKSQQRGALISEQGRSVYVENHLWLGLSEGLQESGASVLQEVSSDESAEEVSKSSPSTGVTGNSPFFLGETSSEHHASHTHPTAPVILKLWHIFQENINPLCKILHVPTTNDEINNAIAYMDGISKPFEALLFSIYLSALMTIGDSECVQEFGESRQVLLSRYQRATQHSLQRSNYIKSGNMVVVQAMVLYLFYLRMVADPEELWIYTGMNLRVAQRIGLHRDGVHLGLSPFESEMRRRLWWQCLVLDSHAATLSGMMTIKIPINWDTCHPININDIDLYPEMKEPPTPRDEATEMIFCMVRYEFGKLFQGRGQSNFSETNIDDIKATLEERDKRIDEVERNIAEKYLKYCDPLIELHVLSNGAARAAINSMRLMAHHPRQYPDAGASLPQEEKEMLFNTSLRILEYDTFAYEAPKIQRYKWHFACFFQWNALVFVLTELCHSFEGEKIAKAWELVGEAYKNHPNIVFENKKSLMVAVKSLTLRAWEHYSFGISSLTSVTPEEPDYIKMIKSQRSQLSDLRKAAADSYQGMGSLILEGANGSSIAGSALTGTTNSDQKPIPPVSDAFFGSQEPLDIMPMDWQAWDDLLYNNNAQEVPEGLFGPNR